MAAIEFGLPAGGRLGAQSITAVLQVACLPAALGGDRMSKGGSDLRLRRQLTLTKGNRHNGPMVRIIERHTIKNLMSAKDNTIAIAIAKGETGIDRSERVAGVSWLGSEERWGRGGIHTSIDAGPSVMVPQTAHTFRRTIGQDSSKTAAISGSCPEV